MGGVKYTSEEIDFGKKLQESFIGITIPPINEAETIEPFELGTRSGGSTDVGDVSWAVPTVGMRAATWIPGTPSHSWQAVACGGTDIGTKGMIVAAKTMAFTGIDLFKNTDHIIKAREEWLKVRGGAEYKYEALLGNRKPALDYRN